MKRFNYKKFIENRFMIKNKDGKIIPFKLNKQQDFYLSNRSKRDIIGKARQQGMSSIISAIFAVDFLIKPNTYSLILCDTLENSKEMLERIKLYLNSYQEITGIKLPMPYYSRDTIVNGYNGSRIKCGTAESRNFGRSRTVQNLHCSEVAFFPDIQSILASALQTVPTNGYAVLESTSHGYNQWRDVFLDAMNGKSNFKPFFFSASEFYTKEELEDKKKESRELFKQEYPETFEESCLLSGMSYFNTEVIAKKLKENENVQPISQF